MNPINIYDVIDYLRPNSQFTMNNGDINTIVFHSNHTTPTNEEIEQAWQKLEDQRSAEELSKVAQKAALLEKLGITEDEARLLLS
jgi:S-adenosylmethionine:tRNA-ribosyltransferase-isomerase (queuine synthetase)